MTKKRIDPKIHIGEEYGIYKIIGVEDEKDEDGHVIYNVQCKECGYKRNSKLSNLKQKNVQKCTHKNLLSETQLNNWYEQNKIKCLFCGKDIPLGKLGFEEYKKRKFCNNSCAASYNGVGRKIAHKKIKINLCKNCGKEINYKNKFCSIYCKHEYEYKEKIRKWKNGELSGSVKDGASSFVKRYIKEKYSNKCCKCGWAEINQATGKVPVEIHHIDGNYQHNEENNLELLCPNCHSLTTTYRALNCGDGRKDRYK